MSSLCSHHVQSSKLMKRQLPLSLVFCNDPNTFCENLVIMKLLTQHNDSTSHLKIIFAVR